MRLFGHQSTRPAACVLLCCVAQASAYFVITEPALKTQWTNGVANVIHWSKGVRDGIDSFDVELARLSQDGLTYVARNVPSRPKTSLNIMLQDVPPGNDYFLIFINSTHGVLHATSPRFTILPSSTTSNSSQLSPDSSVPTVTVSGAPNPTMPFATTFPAVVNGVLGGWTRLPAGEMWSVGGVMIGCVMSAVWTLW